MIDLNLITLIFTLNMDCINTLIESRDCQIGKKRPNKNAAKKKCALNIETEAG